MQRPIVIVESPYAGDTGRNHTYWKAAMLDSALGKKEVPLSSHFFYTSVFDDTDEVQRKVGIDLGYQMWPAASKVVFYMDLGMSPGMKAAWKRAEKMDLPREQRWIGLGWEDGPAAQPILSN